MPALRIVLRGIVDLTHLSGKSECGVLLLSSKDLLLPATTMFHEPALVSARALTNTKVLMLDGTRVEAVLARSTVLAANLMRAMSGQWRMAVRNSLDLNCRSAAQRVGAFLLRLADLQSDTAAPVLPIAKRHLAVRLGMSAETLSRMLQTVAAHGLVLAWPDDRHSRPGRNRGVLRPRSLPGQGRTAARRLRDVELRDPERRL